MVFFRRWHFRKAWGWGRTRLVQRPKGRSSRPLSRKLHRSHRITLLSNIRTFEHSNFRSFEVSTLLKLILFFCQNCASREKKQKTSKRNFFFVFLLKQNLRWGIFYGVITFCLSLLQLCYSLINLWILFFSSNWIIWCLKRTHFVLHCKLLKLTLF